MKLIYTLFIGMTLTCQAKIGVEYQMQLGNPTDAKLDNSNHEHYLIQRSVLAEDYDDERGEPNWVAWDPVNDIYLSPPATTIIPRVASRLMLPKSDLHCCFTG